MNGKIMLATALLAAAGNASAGAWAPESAFFQAVEVVRIEARAGAEAAASRYRAVWTGGSYECRNMRGRAGLNRVSKARLLASFDGECADLSRMDLRGAYLENANLIGARLEEANLAYANLRGANLIEADLAWADLSGTLLDEANLGGAMLALARLGQAGAGACTRMRRTNLSRAVMVRVTASCADLRRANLEAADLREADLSGADLGDAALKGAAYSPGTRFPERFNPLRLIQMRRSPPILDLGGLLRR